MNHLTPVEYPLSLTHDPNQRLSMYCKIQLVMYTGDGREETVTDVLTLMKDSQRIEHLGLALAEAKQLLTLIQQHLLAQQIDAFLAAHSCCEGCGLALKVKGDQTRTFRTLFGTFTLSSPRLFHCRCQHRKTIAFRPLTSAHRAGRPRIALDRNQVGLAGLVWIDRPGAHRLSPARGDTGRQDRASRYPEGRRAL